MSVGVSPNKKAADENTGKKNPKSGGISGQDH
jgi:hypothetical protein